METTAAFTGLRCTDCGEAFSGVVHGRCEACGGTLDPTYDLSAAFADGLRPPTPVAAPYTAGEGDTPLVETPTLAEELGIERAFLKDEGCNPTGTVYDRGMAVAVTLADAADVEPLALAAAGNAAQSAAAYANRVGRRSYAFVPSRTAFSNKAMVNVHGGEMRVVGGRYDDAVAAVDEQLATEYYSLSAFETPYRHDGAKTLVYETLAEYTAAVQGGSADPAARSSLAAPDALVVPVGTGELLVGVATGLAELDAADRLEARPTLVAVQPAGCAPIASAYEADRDPEPWATPDTIVGELEIPNPVGGSRAVAVLRETDANAVTVSDDDALESAVAVARNEVVEVGGAGGVALAGAWELGSGLGDDAIVVNPDAGVKTPDILRSHLMGQGV